MNSEDETKGTLDNSDEKTEDQRVLTLGNLGFTMTF